MANSVSIDSLRPEIWRKELMADVIDKMFFNVIGAMKASPANVAPNAVVHLVNDLKKNQGDGITLGLTAKLGDSTGVTGDNELEGNESAITPYSEQILISQFRDAVRLTGRLDEQKNAYNMRTDAREKLSIRIREFMERQAIHKLAGVLNPTITDVNGTVVSGQLVDASAQTTWSNSPDAIPDADMAAGTGNRYICANTGGGDGLGATDLMTAKLITRAKNKAKLASPKIEPVEYKGKKWYLMLVHPWVMSDLRDNAVLAQAFREAWWRGDENPLFSGADLVWDGVVIHEHEYMPFLDVSAVGNNFTAAGSGEDFAVDTFRSLLLGKQALGVALCEDGPKWVEKDFDYGNKWAISCGIMGGIQKIMFNSKEYGVIAIDTAATAQ